MEDFFLARVYLGFVNYEHISCQLRLYLLVMRIRLLKFDFHQIFGAMILDRHKAD
jgi:hypothetical protein